MKYLIIGAGIIGASIARELAMRKIGEVVVIEKENNAGLHISGRNSGVIHSGINQKPGTLKAKLCVDGSKLLREYCNEQEVPMQENGTIVVATTENEQIQLRNLFNSAIEANVPQVRIITKEELKEREPRAKGLEALFSPTGAVVDSKLLMEKIVSDTQSKGVEFKWNTQVKTIHNDSLETTNGNYSFQYLINCAGLNSDTIAHTNNLGNKYSIIPFRGDYIEVPAKVNSMIYHLPDMRFPFLGVHLTKTVEGKVIAGPTATLSFAGREGYEGGINRKFFSETANTINFWAWTTRALTSPSTLKQILHNLNISTNPEKFLEDIQTIYEGDINMDQSQPYRSGIRPQIVDRQGKLVNDFLIEQSKNQLHILNAVSPGLTASFAFAKHITEKYIFK